MKPRRTPLFLPGAALFASLILGLSACGPDPGSAPPVSAAAEREFTVRGEVQDIPPGSGALLIQHDAIPGYMPRMTMELTLLHTNDAAGLQVGDRIEFRLVARREDHFIDRIRVLSQATPAAETAARVLPSDGVPELRVGDPMPDVELLTEHDRRIRLSSFRGQVVAFTFFFTRCPLPDYCPRMNRNLLEARNILLSQPGSPREWTLLSLSFDAEFDRPPVLAAHARGYRGPDEQHWTFGVVEAPALAVLRPALDLKVAREQGSFAHNLRTVVVDPIGNVFRQFDGNRWTPADLAAAITEAAAKGASRAP